MLGVAGLALAERPPNRRARGYDSRGPAIVADGHGQPVRRERRSFSADDLSSAGGVLFRREKVGKRRDFQG